MIRFTSCFSACTVAVLLFAPTISTAREAVFPDGEGIVEFDFGGGKKRNITTKVASWYLGVNLGTTVALKSTEAKGDMYAKQLSKASALADVLDIDLPEMPEITGKAHVWDGRNYLVNLEADSVASRLLARHGRGCTATFLLAAHSSMGGPLYAPIPDDPELGKLQKSFNEHLVFQLKENVLRANFRNREASIAAVKRLTDWIENGRPGKGDYVKQMFSVFSELGDLLVVESEMVVKAAAAAAAEKDSGDPFTMVSAERAASFYLGKNLGVGIVLKVLGADRERYAGSFSRAETIADPLGIELPELPVLEEITHIFAGYEYLMGPEPDSIRNLIAQRRGDDCAAIFSLMSDIALSRVFYAPVPDDPKLAEFQSKVNRDLVRRLKIATVRADFTEKEAAVAEVMRLVEWIESGRPSGTDFGKNLDAIVGALEKLLMMEGVKEAGEMDVSDAP